MEAIKRGETLFQNDYNHLVSSDNPILSDYTFSTVSNYIQPAAIALCIFSLIFMLYLCRKVNKLTVSVMALSARVPITEAQKYLLFSTTSSIPPPTDTSVTTTHIYLGIIIALLAGFAIFYAAKEGYKARRTKKFFESLTLRFGNPKTHINIQWTHLLYPFAENKLEALSVLRRVRVSRSGLKFYLKFDWNFEICHINSGLRQRPPSQICLSIREYYKLSSILNGYQGYRTTLWVTRSGIHQEIIIEPTSTSNSEPNNHPLTENESNTCALLQETSDIV